MTVSHDTYNDQCDIAYMRLRRLVECDPERLEEMKDESAVVLGIDGLGLSGGQAEEVIAQLLRDLNNLRDLREAVETGWVVIANAKGWGGGPSEWLTAAENWRDNHYSSLK